ncbi:MAG: 50S ribosomal protein P1 [Candidatus Micrarchaeota archaeon]|nr:50S ribosomal protein P1 [Candidatus Micrarchaeota archaeon]
MRKALERKKKIVEELTEMIKSHKTVGLLNLYKIPTPALQKIREDLRNTAKIKVAKKSLILRAFENCGLSRLSEFIDGQPALILSNENPFRLSMLLRKKKSQAPAKPGDVAPKDILVPAGPTNIPPGPAISTLTKVKIPAKVEGGKIAVLKDFVVCKKGETITEDIAAALNLLGIKPIEIGLEILAAFENGLLYTKDVLSIEPEKFVEELIDAKSKALSLAVEISYFTPETIEHLLIKAFQHMKTLGIETGLTEPGIIEDVLSKAFLNALAISERGGEMEYVYGALLLHSAGKEINEENVKKVLEAAGIQVDEARVKALVASLEGVNIEEVLSKATTVQAPQVQQAPAEEKKEEKKEEEEEKKAEQATEGLASLFG